MSVTFVGKISDWIFFFFVLFLFLIKSSFFSSSSVNCCPKFTAPSHFHFLGSYPPPICLSQSSSSSTTSFSISFSNSSHHHYRCWCPHLYMSPQATTVTQQPPLGFLSLMSLRMTTHVTPSHLFLGVRHGRTFTSWRVSPQATST